LNWLRRKWLGIQIRYYKWRVGRLQRKLREKHAAQMAQLEVDVHNILEEPNVYEMEEE